MFFLSEASWSSLSVCWVCNLSVFSLRSPAGTTWIQSCIVRADPCLWLIVYIAVKGISCPNHSGSIGGTMHVAFWAHLCNLHGGLVCVAFCLDGWTRWNVWLEYNSAFKGVRLCRCTIPCYVLKKQRTIAVTEWAHCLHQVAFFRLWKGGVRCG